MIGESVSEDGFTQEFVHVDVTAALDLDEWFAGWNFDITQSMANTMAEVRELLEGAIVY
ncbi:hypothetical protein ACFL2S_12430 [Thermodesulfobacteriota bacterium]